VEGLQFGGAGEAEIATRLSDSRNRILTDFVPETENIKFNYVWVYLTAKKPCCIMLILLNGE
jgi:hypothetical protein